MNIPFLSILEETVLRLKKLKVRTVGILATQSTVDSKIYSSILQKNKISVLYPSKTEQDEINKIIVKALNGETEFDNKKIRTIFNFFHKRGAEIILLACTDLQLATSKIKSPIPVIDTTEILIQASVRELIK